MGWMRVAWVAVLVAAVAGAVAGAVAATALSRDADSGVPAPERGSIVRLPAELHWTGLDVWCNEHHRFCIPRFDDPADARAYYRGDTSSHFRQMGCFVEWREDFDLSGYDLPPDEPSTGAFRGGCSGSTFLRDGTRVFGPAPRSLDQFPIEVETQDVDGRTMEWLLVDTRALTCGAWVPSYPREQIPDPECELAPPHD